MRRFIICMAVLTGTAGLAGSRPDSASAEQAKRLVSPTGPRRPCGLVLSDSTGRLYVGNARSGTVSVIDPAALALVGESRVAERLADVRLHPDGSHLLALDAERSELLVLHAENDGVSVVSRTQVPDDPLRIAVDPKRRRCAVSGRWSHKVSLVDLADAGEPVVHENWKLPFAPRELMFLAEHDRLVVAGAFGGQFAVVDLISHKVESVRRLSGHNLHGLALSRDGSEIYVSHPQLHPEMRADYEDLTWGRLLFNGVTAVSVAALLDPAADLAAAGRMIHLRNAGDAAGDPGPILVDARGRVVVLLSGDGQIAVGENIDALERIEVGLQPVAVAMDEKRKRLYVANRLDESVSVVDLHLRFVQRNIPLGAPAESTAEDRGERLFYDARLSHDRWMSCHSCHTDGHSNGLLVDTLGDGGYGDPKRVPSLLGVGETAPYAWNGSLPTLEEQIHKSILTTLHGPPVSADQAADLAAFLRSLPLPSAVEPVDENRIAAGRRVFDARRCDRCHAPPMFTTADVFDVGLTDAVGNREFNPPSLRGVGQRETLFHDGRARNLADVFGVHAHQLDRPLDESELDALVAFLRSL